MCFYKYELKSNAILGDLRISMMIVSSKVTSPKVFETVMIQMIMMIVIAVMIVIYCVMNNFLLVVHLVDKMWNVHPDVYTGNRNHE